MAQLERGTDRSRRSPEEDHGHRTLDEVQAHRARTQSGREKRGRTGDAADELLVQVCERCGKEYMFSEGEPPSDLTCDKCGNQVFRSFYSPMRYDEVQDDFRRTTERDLAPNDDESDVTRGDIIDLNNP